MVDVVNAAAFSSRSWRVIYSTVFPLAEDLLASPAFPGFSGGEFIPYARVLTAGRCNIMNHS